MAPTRRARQRASTVAEIKEAAWTQIAEEGAPSLSLRGVARAIGMSPAGLYRYYDGLDELLTALLVDAYEALADAVEAAIEQGRPDGHVAAFLAGVRAYRRWAVEHPNRFLLIFGTPIPGYAAPERGPTVEANRRMGQALLILAAEAWTEGRIADPPPARSPSPVEVALAEELESVAEGFPVGLVAVLLSAWAHWHGLVILEVTNQLDWVYPDATAFFDVQVERIVEEIGLQRRP